MAFDNVEKGEEVTVFYQTNPSTAPEGVTGIVTSRYGSDGSGGFAMTTDGNKFEGNNVFRVTKEDVKRGNHRDGFEEEVGRFMFIEVEE